MELGLGKIVSCLVLSVVLLACQSTVEHSITERKPDFNTLYEKAQSDKQAQIDLVELVIQEPEWANSFLYFLASNYAISLDRVEDAGFLFFAGQARGAIELYMHPAPPGGAGSALGALRHTIGSVVNPAIMQPRVYSNIVSRFDTWEVIPHPNYDFPWDKTNNQKSAKELAHKGSEIKSSMLTHMKPMADLLGIPEYYKAFKTIQDYNLTLSYEQQTDPQFLEAFNDAKNVIVTIEKSKGYDILKSRFDKA